MCRRKRGANKEFGGPSLSDPLHPCVTAGHPGFTAFQRASLHIDSTALLRSGVFFPFQGRARILEPDQARSSPKMGYRYLPFLGGAAFLAATLSGVSAQVAPSLVNVTSADGMLIVDWAIATVDNSIRSFVGASNEWNGGGMGRRGCRQSVSEGGPAYLVPSFAPRHGGAGPSPAHGILAVLRYTPFLSCLPPFLAHPCPIPPCSPSHSPGHGLDDVLRLSPLDDCLRLHQHDA